MAFVAALAPYLAAAGAAYSGIKQAQSQSYNAAVTGQEQKIAVDQANAQSNLIQRSSRESLGRQAAAFGAAGVGYGGSSEVALDQSAINSELDSLNEKYKGAISGYGYGVQSSLDSSQATQSLVSGGLLAGSALLKNQGSSYTFAPGNFAVQSGQVAPGGSSGLGR